MRCQVAAFAVVLFVAAAGCGGGGSSSTGEPAPEAASFSFGNLEGRAAATNPPLTTNSDLVTATGLKGAITSLILRDQSTSLDETRIVFSATIHEPTQEIYIANYDGSDLRRLTFNSLEDHMPQVSPKGDKIAFVRNGDIHTMSINGSAQTNVTNTITEERHPSWSPNGNEIVFAQFSGSWIIAKVNLTTTVITPLTSFSSFHDWMPIFTPDGSQIMFASTRNGNAAFNLFTVPAAGGAPAAFGSPGANNIYFPTFSPDGSWLAMLSDDGSTTQLIQQAPNPNGLTRVISSDANYQFDWSPDGSRLAFTRYMAGWYLFTIKADGSDEQELFRSIPGEKPSLSWAPAGDKVFVAASGAILASSADGFIVGQQGPTTRGLLVFDATTPSSVVMTEQTGLNNDGPNLVFSIDADNVTLISYANTPSWKATKVVGSGTSLTSASGALVSLDSATGKVVAVLPFTGTRARQSVRDEGGTRIFEGSFLGAFDAVGANAAPSGASTVRLDLASGRLEAG